MTEGKRGFLSWLRGGDDTPPSPAEDRDERAPADAEPPSEPLGERLEDLGLIAKGGMSAVRLARDNTLLRKVAMKVLAPRIAEKPIEVQRFVEEAQITGQLEHPNIPPVHEIGVDDEGSHYFTMKYVQGSTLEDLLREEDFDLEDEAKLFEILQVFVKTCQAIDFAHSRGVIHCDLKPRNVMAGTHGQVYVMDWGIARLLGATRPTAEDQKDRVELTNERARSQDDGRVMGTVGFMSPEQAQGRNSDLDARSDVFQLGAVLYRILTGRAPYAAGTTREAVTLAAGCQFIPPEVMNPSPAVPRRLCAIVTKAMAPDPDERYPTAAALQKDIENFMRGVGHYPTRTYKAGELILEEGDSGEEAFVILRGRCQAFKTDGDGRRPLREMRKGAVFGEAAMFAASTRTASVEAIDETTVAVVTRESLSEEIGVVAGPFVRTLAERFHDIDKGAAFLRKERDSFRVAQEALRYLNLRGDPQDVARPAPWTPLARHLRERLGWTDEQVYDVARHAPGVRVDLEGNQVSLRVPTDLQEIYPDDEPKQAPEPEPRPEPAAPEAEEPSFSSEQTIRVDSLEELRAQWEAPRAVADPDADSDAEPRVVVAAELRESGPAESDSDSDSESDSESAPDSEPQSESDSQADSEAAPDSELQSESDSQADSESPPDSESEPQSESDSQADSESAPESASESEPQSEPDSESESESQPQSEPEPEPEPPSEEATVAMMQAPVYDDLPAPSAGTAPDAEPRVIVASKLAQAGESEPSEGEPDPESDEKVDTGT